MLTSTPVKSYLHETTCSVMHEDSESTIITSKNDPTYVPCESDDNTDLDIQDDNENHLSFVDEKKFLTFYSCIISLVKKIVCCECNSPSDYIKTITIGTALRIISFCIEGHRIISWESQPMLGKMPVGNLLSSVSITLSGETYQRIAHLCKIMGLQFISQSVHDQIQRE
jgi:hypothetical protein